VKAVRKSCEETEKLSSAHEGPGQKEAVGVGLHHVVEVDGEGRPADVSVARAPVAEARQLKSSAPEVCPPLQDFAE